MASLSSSLYDVVIIGAGAAGLSAGHSLVGHGIDNFIILEANGPDGIGGRMKDADLGPHTVSLGATWMSHSPTPFRTLSDLVNDGVDGVGSAGTVLYDFSTDPDFTIVPDLPTDVFYWIGTGDTVPSVNDTSIVVGRSTGSNTTLGDPSDIDATTSNMTTDNEVENENDDYIDIHHPYEYYAHQNNTYMAWVKGTWRSFYEKHIIPEVDTKIQTGCVVDTIDYNEMMPQDDSGETRGGTTASPSVRVSCEDGTTVRARYAIVTVPIKVLQRQSIDFIPPLPPTKQAAIDEVIVNDGMMIYVLFSHHFFDSKDLIFKYPSPNYFEPVDGYIMVWDALEYRGTGGRSVSNSDLFDPSTSAVMGILLNHEFSKPYIDLPESEIESSILALLDEAFDGNATAYYEDMVIQNWSKEPHIGGIYSDHLSGGTYGLIAEMAEPVGGGHVHFAGEAMEDQGFITALVWGAAMTGRRAVADIVTHMEDAVPMTPSSSSRVSIQTSILYICLAFSSFYLRQQ